MLWKIVFVLYFVFFLGLGETSDILIVFGVSSPSNMRVYWPLVFGLQKSGHNVTVVSPYVELSEELQNITVIELEENKHYLDEILMERGVISLSLNRTKLVDGFYNDEYITQVLADRPHFDVIITDCSSNNFILPLAYFLNCPVIFLCSSDIRAWTAYSLDVPHSFSFYSRWNSRMDQYHVSIAIDTLLSFVDVKVGLIEDFKEDEAVRKYLLKSPPIADIRKNVSLILVHSHPLLDNVKKWRRGFVNVGPLYFNQPNSLPQEIDYFIEDTGEDGFVVVSFVTDRGYSSIVKESINKLCWVSLNISQKIILETNLEIEFKCSNFKISHHIPLEDILGHPKAKLLITHGNLHTLQVAVWNTIPVIGIPFTHLDDKNIERAKKLGFAEKIPCDDWTPELLSSLINQTTTDPRYKIAASSCSRKLKRYAMTGLPRAIFYTEYIIAKKWVHLVRPEAPFYWHIGILTTFMSAFCCLLNFLLSLNARTIQI